MTVVRGEKEKKNALLLLDFKDGCKNKCHEL
jgi:hypothetical protein